MKHFETFSGKKIKSETFCETIFRELVLHHHSSWTHIYSACLQIKSLSSALLISRCILGLGQRGRCCFCTACTRLIARCILRLGAFCPYRIYEKYSLKRCYNHYSLKIICLTLKPDTLCISGLIFLFTYRMIWKCLHILLT